MAGIQRFITYIYAYEEGKKGANKGFAKVEVRGSECRMEIHIRDIRKNCLTGDVYLFFEKDGMIESVSIGEMKFTDGRGDCGIVLKTTHIRDTACSFREMEGVMIILDDQTICLSRWKEGRAIEVRLEKVKRLSSFGDASEALEAEKTTTEPQTAKTEKLTESQADEIKKLSESESQMAGNESSTESQMAESESPKESQVAGIESPLEPQAAGIEYPSEQGRTKPAEQQPANTANSMETETVASDTTWQENIQTTEIPMRNIFPQYQWLEVWEELQNTHPTFVVHHEKEILCVCIELKDLRELPQKYWYFGNNSFLLHGFFNYRYLIIGRLEADRWFLGVPGVYQPQERVMAAIFGFTEFLLQDKPVEKKEAHRKTPEGNLHDSASDKQIKEGINQFGYWYHVF